MYKAESQLGTTMCVGQKQVLVENVEGQHSVGMKLRPGSSALLSAVPFSIVVGVELDARRQQERGRGVGNWAAPEIRGKSLLDSF